MVRPPWKPNAPTPDNSGPTPGECLCVIVAAHNADPLSGYPPNVNVSQAWTYTVDAQTPNGIVRYVNVIPAGERWESDVLVRSLPSGSNPANGRPYFYSGSMMDGAFFLHAKEDRWAAPCGFTPGTGGGS